MKLNDAETVLLLGIEEPGIALAPDTLDEGLEYEELATIESVEGGFVVIGKFVLISLAFSSVTDAIAQTVFERRRCGVKAKRRYKPHEVRPYDWKRTFQFMGTGVVFVGLAQFVRLCLLKSMFGNDPSWKTALKKTCINQFVLSPIVNAGALATITFCATWSCEEVREKLAADFLEAQLVSYLVKPIGNFIAFVVFPANMVGQVTIMRIVALCYNVYFSIVAHRDSCKHHKKIDDENEGEEDDDEEEEKTEPKPRDGTMCCTVQ